MSEPLADPRLRQFIEEIVGPEGARVAAALMSREEATDSELAENLGAKPSHIRKILYDLYEARIAEYHKEKDKETGWLTFYWRIPQGNAQHALHEKYRRDLLSLEERLRFEREHEFFVCPSGGERFDFGNATEHEFHCPEHGEVLQHHDNTQEIAKLMKEIELLRHEAGEEA
jgi:transcription initiation factor TFIIE subunit alpha